MKRAVLALLLLTSVAQARDTTGLSDTLTPEQQIWTKGLRGLHGTLCCDEADGIDPVWWIEGDRYMVNYKGQNLVVEPAAVIKEPNRIGVARAWIGWNLDGYSAGKPYVRCFLPGPVS